MGKTIIGIDIGIASRRTTLLVLILSSSIRYRTALPTTIYAIGAKLFLLKVPLEVLQN